MTHAGTSHPSTDLDAMHELYRHGGVKHVAVPNAVYSNATCPHPDCAQHLQGINFRLEAFGRAVHDVLVKAWWDDTGFAGRCPTCGRWIHFTIRGKRAIDEQQAASLSQLPPNWASEAVIL